jgi:chromate transporter
MHKFAGTKKLNMNSNLKEVAAVFFKLGCFAFGGPAAHIAMMEQEVVERRKWMTREHYLDLIGATNLIPGPNSTEMTMHCGHERAGRAGLFVAGISFIVPAIVITGVLAWLYTKYGELPTVAPFLIGIKPAVLAIIAQAVLKLGKKATKNTELIVLGIAVVLACLLGAHEVLVLLVAGVLGAVYFTWRKKAAIQINPLMALILGQAATPLLKIGSLKIFLTFLKVGSILYGSGYVLFAYLDAELVAKGWLTHAQLMDAIAVGQFTPGPVLSTATFIGYQLNGLSGALASSAGIFLPSFLFVLLLNPIIPRLRTSQFFSSFLDAVNVAAVGVMLAVLIQMTTSSLTNWQNIVIAVVSLALVFGLKKVSAIWVVVIGAVLGYALTLI